MTPGCGARVLVIDDDEAGRSAVAALLSVEGWEVEEACDAARALAAMTERTHEIVILDINMPGMSGVEALPKIKSLNPFASVVMLTAYSSVLNVASAIGDGAVDYFVKPIEDIDEFIEALRGLARKAERWRRELGVHADGGEAAR
jgi:two-component system response regulator MprA